MSSHDDDNETTSTLTSADEKLLSTSQEAAMTLRGTFLEAAADGTVGSMVATYLAKMERYKHIADELGQKYPYDERVQTFVTQTQAWLEQ